MVRTHGIKLMMNLRKNVEEILKISNLDEKALKSLTILSKTVLS